MFGKSYFGPHYFGGHYFGHGSGVQPPGATAAQIWAYVLPNGKSAGQNLAEINNIVTGPIDGVVGLKQALQILLAIAVGETTINKLGGGNAIVTFTGAAVDTVRVEADMVGSVRADVQINL